MKKNYAIAVVGLWHLGEIYSAGLAELGHSVTGIAQDTAVAENLSKGVPPLAEPRLEAMLKSNIEAERLHFSTDIAAVGSCDVLWITFDTPVNDRDESDINPIMNAIRNAAPHLREESLIVVSSQLPAGTSERIVALVRELRPGLRFHYVYSPENLRLGEAVNCFLEPQRIVIGAEDDEAARRLEDIFEGTHAAVLRMSPASAEMAKHALNSFLATSISFINDIADACDAVGADVLDVVRALKSDERIGARAALNPGLGFSGGTLGRDLVALAGLAKEKKISLPIIEHAFKKNKNRPNAIIADLGAILDGVQGKKITILGLTYKAGTSTLRRSRSLEIANALSGQGALLVLCDPHVNASEIPTTPNSAFVADPYAASAGAHALVFITPWPDFREFDFKKMAAGVSRGAVILDTTNFLADQADVLEAFGFRYYGIGRHHNETGK